MLLYCRNGSYNRVTCINYQSNAYFFPGKKHRERNDVSAQNRGDSLLRISLDDILKGQKHKCFNTFPHVKKMNTAFILHRNGGYFTYGEAKKRIIDSFRNSKLPLFGSRIQMLWTSWNIPFMFYGWKVKAICSYMPNEKCQKSRRLRKYDYINVIHTVYCTVSCLSKWQAINWGSFPMWTSKGYLFIYWLFGLILVVWERKEHKSR